MQDKHISQGQNDQALDALLQDTLPENKDKQLIQATVLEIGDRNVLLDTHLKADGVVSVNEFKDTPNLKVGDEIEVYVENQEDRHGELIVSRKKAKKLRGWQTIEDAYKSMSTVLPSFYQVLRSIRILLPTSMRC